MKIPFITKIILGFVIILSMFILVFGINLFTQNIYNQFEDDYKTFQVFSDSINKIFYTQIDYFIEYDLILHNRLKQLIEDIRMQYILLNQMNLYRTGDEEIKLLIDEIVVDVKEFVSRYEPTLDKIYDFGLDKMKLDEEQLTREELEQQKSLGLLIDQYLIGKQFEDQETGVSIYVNKSVVISDNIRYVYRQFEKKRLQLNSVKNWINYFVASIAIVITILISAVFILVLKEPFEELKKYIQVIAAGDFSAEINLKSNDEIKVLANNLKKIISFQETLIKIRKCNRSLDENFNHTREGIDIIQLSTQEQDMSIKQAHQLFVRLNEALNIVSKNSFQTRENAYQIRKRTHVSTEQIRETLTDIKLLSQIASNIMGIVKIITTITTQTELLSLNAAIESAKAGLIGQGFAVVANEIRKLSEISASSTKEISNLAKSINAKIKLTTAKSELSVEALQIIENSIEDIAKVVTEISDSTEKESISSQNILKIVSNINQLSENNNENIGMVVENNINIRQQLDQLVKLLGKFRLPDFGQGN